MSCCTTRHTASASRFFSWFAGRYRRRFQKKGLEKTQRQLLQGILQAGLDGMTLLEIGCGVGYLHQRLLKRGAISATGIDLSQKMLDEARTLAEESGLSREVRYRQGDFVELASTIETHDIAILDKVICCYPDVEALVKQSLAKTHRTYALTYPRAHMLNRLGMLFGAVLMRLIGCRFRGYVHDPSSIAHWIAEAGFKKDYQNKTFVWLTEVYVK